MSPFGKFSNPRDPNNLAITKKVKEWVSELFCLPEDTFVMVNEVNCCDDNCPTDQTQIIILFPNKQHLNFMLGKPLTFVRKWDVEALLPQRTS